MNRRYCINCQKTWGSLADHELDAPHTCPECGDQLVAVAPVELSAEVDSTLERAAA